MCVLSVPQGSRDYFGIAVLWSHRHVVAGLCDRWTFSGLAPLPRGPGVWPGKHLFSHQSLFSCSWLIILEEVPASLAFILSFHIFIKIIPASPTSAFPLPWLSLSSRQHHHMKCYFFVAHHFIVGLPSVYKFYPPDRIFSHKLPRWPYPTPPPIPKSPTWLSRHHSSLCFHPVTYFSGSVSVCLFLLLSITPYSFPPQQPTEERPQCVCFWVCMPSSFLLQASTRVTDSDVAHAVQLCGIGHSWLLQSVSPQRSLAKSQYEREAD